MWLEQIDLALLHEANALESKDRRRRIESELQLRLSRRGLWEFRCELTEDEEFLVFRPVPCKVFLQELDRNECRINLRGYRLKLVIDEQGPHGLVRCDP